MHYHVLGLNESSTENNMKKNCKLALQSRTDKNKHPQASTVMRTIAKDKEGLE